ncbi:MAG: hypothetical protein GY810_24450 [Aureispira sp.]|nr:hypothetical protein [Aureispira sp.]
MVTKKHTSTSFQHLVILFSLMLFLSACQNASPAIKAKEEALAFMFLSSVGIGCLAIAILIPHVISQASNNLETVSTASFFTFFPPLFILLFWAFQLATTWLSSNAYAYGEGSLVIVGLFSVAVAAFISINLQIKDKLAILRSQKNIKYSYNDEEDEEYEIIWKEEE